MTRRRVALLTATLCAALVAGVAGPAAAAGPTTGVDVSQYQCGRPWAVGQAFTVVAVNTGLPTGTNPCLAEQLSLAAASTGQGHPAVEVYVNTANPAPKAASWWPTSDRARRGASVKTPYGHCTGTASRACSYVYGASLALDDLQVRGVPAGVAARWWLDVEVANSWKTSKKHGTTYLSTSDQAQNRAVLEGMTSRFTAAGQKVGLYALSHEFADLIGTVPASSPLSALPSWLAGAADQQHAATVCTREPLTEGRVLLAQWLVRSGTDKYDFDLACADLPKKPKPTVAGTKKVGKALTAKDGAWGAGVQLAHRWTRDGKTIDGATKGKYTLKKADAGHRVAVVVIATKDGYSRAERTSASVSVRR